MTLRKAEKLLVENDRAFDAEIIRSALKLYNGTHSDEVQARLRSGPIMLGDLVRAAYGWLPETLRARAERAGIDPNNVKWMPMEAGMDIVLATSVLLYTVGAFSDQSVALRFRTAPVLEGKQRPTPLQWVNSVLAVLPIYSRFVLDGHTFRQVSVPLLTTVQRCVAYAMVIVWTDRHGFRNRVRRCDFLTDPTRGSLAHHLFLADDARQRFCSLAHSNAYRQRVWRREHAPRKPK